MSITPSSVLDALTGKMTARNIAERLGEPGGRPIQTQPILNSLRGEGKVVREVDTRGTPVARWRLA